MTSSPTPAVLPDARARCNYCGGSGRFQIVSPVSDHAWATCFCSRPATPPASDAAIPEGERTDADLLRLIAKDHERLAPNAYHSADTLRQIADRIAAAPKVASDTGAGLREALRAIEQHINDFAGCDDSPSGDEVESDARNGLAYLRQHLAATPTDATDGATGGGEVRTRLIRAGMHESANSSTTLIPYSIAARAVAEALATTPGGDLLEQAFRAECHCAGDLAPQTYVVTLAAFQRAVARALKPAGDGGEA